MKIKLNNLERISLAGILPKEENYLTFKIITELKLELSFTESEFKKYGIQNLPGNKVGWSKDGMKEIDIPETIKEMICIKLIALEKEKKINADNISLYERFILNKSIKRISRKK